MDNLIFMAQLYGVPSKERREKAEELLKIFRLHERKDSLFRTFSRGMKRALTIAAALIHNPKILFLDEPTVGLDVVAARSLRNLIGNLHQQGITIFLTTHYLEEADILCDRAAIIVKGQIMAIDTPENLKVVRNGRDRSLRVKSLEEAFMKITGLEPEVLAIEKGK
jgi:ABC-2 type transport system ATP-binding protein